MLAFEDLSNQYHPKPFQSIIPHNPDSTNACASGPCNTPIPAKTSLISSICYTYILKRPRINFGTAKRDCKQVTWPPLLSSDTLAQAVSHIVISMDGWENEAPVDIFNLFTVLVEPPASLNLDTIPGLPEYLDNLCNQVLKIDNNCIHGSISNHSFQVLYGI